MLPRIQSKFEGAKINRNNQNKWKNEWNSAQPVIQFPHRVMIYILNAFLLKEAGSERLDNKAYTSVLDTNADAVLLDWSS